MRPAALVVVLLGLAIARTSFCAEPADARAGQLFDRAELEYQAGRFREAISLLLEAQKMAPDPVLHYNLARAYEGLGELQPALDAYRAYLRAAPTSRDRGAVETRIRSLEQLIAERNKPPGETPHSEGSSAGSSPSAAPWVVAGIGALGLGVGGLLGGIAAGKSSEAEDPETNGRLASERRDEATTLATAANVTFAIAGTALAAGVVWGIIDVSTSGDVNAPVSSKLKISVASSGVWLTVKAL